MATGVDELCIAEETVEAAFVSTFTDCIADGADGVADGDSCFTGASFSESDESKSEDSVLSAVEGFGGASLC